VVAHLFERKPDWVLLHIVFPDCDGRFLNRFLDKLRLVKKALPIVVSSLHPIERRSQSNALCVCSRTA
jgi:hypothetical protein